MSAVSVPTILRQKLWEITDGPNKAPSSEHVRLFSALASEISHTIKVAPDPYGGAVPLERYTCFLHVLDLARCERYIRIAGCYPDVFAGTEFMRFLIEKGVLKEIVDRRPKEGGIVVYFEGDRPKHAGVLTSGRVRSKWGTGLFLEHGLWEVPISYGHDCKFFRPITQNEALEAFLGFASPRAGLLAFDGQLPRGPHFCWRIWALLRMQGWQVGLSTYFAVLFTDQHPLVVADRAI